GGRESVALLRTAAMHMYTWRLAHDLIDKQSAAAQPHGEGARLWMGRVWGEHRTEALLTRAVELEPFHCPTLAALAFVVLQGGGCVELAQGLLERVLASCGRHRAPPGVLRALAGIHATRGNRSLAVSFLRQASQAYPQNPLILVTLAQVLLQSAPHPLQAQSSPTLISVLGGGLFSLSPNSCPGVHSIVGFGDGDPATEGAGAGTRLAAGVTTTEQSDGCMGPSSAELEEGERLLAMAFSLRVHPNNGQEEESVGGGGLGGQAGDQGYHDEDKGTRCDGMDGRNGLLREFAEAHLIGGILALSGLPRGLRENERAGVECGGKQGENDPPRSAECSHYNEKEALRHFEHASRAGLKAKAGLTARYLLGKHALAQGDHKHAEKLFLEALDAEPTTFGACAGYLLLLQQVSHDAAASQARYNRLKRRCRRKPLAKRVPYLKAKASGSRLDVAQRTSSLLNQLQEYATLRKRFMGKRLHGPGLARANWALSLEEGWEERYMLTLQGPPSWSALHLLR
ncbi:unnamed protein product, partial [Discosporangium mesarthrocarpum]